MSAATRTAPPTSIIGRARRRCVGGDTTNGRSRSTGSAPSGTTRATATGSAIPLKVIVPRSS